MPFRDIFTYMKKAGSEEPAKSGMKDLVFLNRDVAVCAMDDAAGIKLPTVVCHALDSCFVLAGKGYTRQTVASLKCIVPDVRHRFWNRHTSQTVAFRECTSSNARHTVRYRYACHVATIVEHLIPDARRICSDFDYFGLFNPSTSIFRKQPSSNYCI